MGKIPDDFCGYLSLGEDTFSYYIAGGIVTLLPAYDEPARQYDAFRRVQSRVTASSEFLYGSDGNTSIAMLRNGDIQTGFFGINMSARFATPLIVKAAGNAVGYFNMLTERWDKFHAITFVGGNINALYDPQIAVEQPDYNELQGLDGARTIQLRSWNSYTKEISFVVKDNPVTLTISISQVREHSDNERMNKYSLGELSSFIRLSFENSQDLDKIEHYYMIARSLVAILTRQNNISFDEIYLSQRNEQNLYFKSADCKLYDYYENYSIKQWHQTIQILSIFERLPRLIEMIDTGKANVLLDVLPDDNKEVNRISITNVQDLCTALEVAYDWEYADEKREKDKLIDELKKDIKITIKEFCNQHKNEIDVNNETTISSSFQYLSYTLATRIYALYCENKEIIDAVTERRSLSPIDENAILSFTRLRNKKVHDGMIEWGNSAQVYPSLLALLYSCLLKHIGIPYDRVNAIIQSIF